ncbi:DUF2325 domain-containing protein [uncultured Desulfuromusa sp.]|uniref:DUF2325 domain-containing protein n=1 Tax=uncultured Desulfuromusa sp. TaxID=219183 RepID=UPI002AA739B1|nr:DUF2325 domain-containing protein [uncultured Desulfuromusa sp.]
MVVLIVGADKIAAFVPKLEELGAEKVLHWSARSQKVTKNSIPLSTDLVIFCTDFLHHTAARTIKKKVKERGLPAVYCRRAWSEIAPEVEQLLSPQKEPQKRCCLCRGCRNCRCKRRSH